MESQPPSSSATSQPNTSTPSATIISPPSTSAGTMQVSSSSSSSNKTPQHLVVSPSSSTRKRKVQATPAISKKKIKTIIACPVALTLLKELGLGRPFFDSGEILAWGLEPTDPVFIRIRDYVHRGQTQYNIKAKVNGVVRIMSKVDSLQNAAIPSDFNEDPSNTSQLRKMLWHGTPSVNVPKILRNGLQLPGHSGIFGKGIYFADRVDLSLGYCRCRCCESGNKAYLFLSDVLLGSDIYKTTKMLDLYVKMKVNWPWQPSKMFPLTSVQGRGSWIPNPEEDQLIDGCVWPMGEVMQDMNNWFTHFHWNIYCIYDEMRVIPKYLVQVEFM